MSEVVEVTAPESSDAEATSQEAAPEAPATPAVDEATWKRRIAGKDQALTAAQQRAAALEAERDQLRQWKAEQEQANMTELQRVQAERDRLAEEAAAAKAEAAAVRLTAKYPLAAELLGDDLTKFDETRVAEINGRLAKEQAGESDAPEARIDPNSPRRNVPKAPSGDPLADAKSALTAAGNPFYDPNE